MPSPIPADQLQRIQPVVDALLADLRLRTQALTPDVELSVHYDPEEAE